MALPPVDQGPIAPIPPLSERFPDTRTYYKYMHYYVYICVYVHTQDLSVTSPIFRLQLL